VAYLRDDSYKLLDDRPALNARRDTPHVAAAYVGSSGWSYPEWRGRFYPADARPEEFLRLYGERLNALELNATFYRLPSEDQLRAWAEATPPGFRFAVKLSRAIAHDGRLDRIGTFVERVSALGEKLGPLLVELPEGRPRDDGFLALLLGSLPPELPVAFEAKDPSWAGADVPVRVNEREGDAPFRYLRLRDHPYDDAALDRLAAWIRAQPVEVWCFFNRGDAADHAPGGEPTAVTAERLSTLLR
jgi:uncharacterized protein YecE (DUF72 family)